MTSTICPSPVHSSPGLPTSAQPGTAPTVEPLGLERLGRPSRPLQTFGQTVRRSAARFWGAGSATLTAQALDAVDVPSFHR